MSERKHILVVEDEAHLALGIQYNLEAEGYRVTTVGDGPAALALLGSDDEAVDLLVLDLMLPGMSGYAVCETLREQGDDVPVLILSARSLAEDRTRGFDVGADQYLQKPFDLQELLARVRNLLARGRIPRAPLSTKDIGPEYRFNSAVVNFDTFKVLVDDQPVRLTYMELKLLRHFIENEGVVVTRSQLLERVWGLASSPTTRTVDNFVMRLRKVFEADPSRPRHFLSVRGAGYRFVRAGEDE
ncbi:MAG: response regulator transcription factor [Pirellulales bacterium]|nr:response regulator transcription factor [Pirellulales bacterium]